MRAPRSALLAATALCLTAAPPALSQINQDQAMESLTWVLRGWDVSVNAVEVGELTGDIVFDGIRATRGQDRLQIDRVAIDGAVYDGAWMIGWDGMRLEKLRVDATGQQLAIEALALETPALDWSAPLQAVRDGTGFENPDVLLDFLLNLEMPVATIEGLSHNNPAEETQIAMDRLAFAGLSGGNLASYELVGLAVTDPDASVALDRFALSDLRFGALITLLAAREDGPGGMEGVSADTLLDLFTVLGSMSLTNLVVVPQGPESTPVTIGAASYDTGPLVNGFPTSTQLSVEEIVIPVESLDDPMAQQVLDEMGIEQLAMSLTGSSDYDPALQTVEGEVAYEFADIGAFIVGTGMVNFDPEEVAAAIVEGAEEGQIDSDAALETVTIAWRDEVFLPRLLEALAPMTGQDPLTMITMAQSGISMLGMMEPELAATAITTSNAVGSMLRDGGLMTLTVTMDPPLSFREMGTMGGDTDPSEFLDRLNITVDYDAP